MKKFARMLVAGALSVGLGSPATAQSAPGTAAGLTAAFAGGAMMGLGHRISRHSPDIQVGAGRFSVSQRVSW